MKIRFLLMNAFVLSLLMSSAAFAGPTTIGLERLDSPQPSQILVQIKMIQPQANLRAVLADLRVDYEPDTIEFVEVRGLVEGKKVFAAPTKEGPIRITLTGVTMDTIQTGPVAILVFKVKANVSAKRTSLRLTEGSKLAPRSAHEGLRIAPALTVELAKGQQK